MVLTRNGMALTRSSKDIVVSDLREAAILKRGFWKDILRPRAIIRSENSMKQLFSAIVTHLCDGDPDKVTHGRAHSLQRSGTCAYSSTMAWLEGALNPLQFRCLELFMMQEGLGVLHSFIDNGAETVHEFQNLTATVDFEEFSGIGVVRKIDKLGREKFRQLKTDLSDTLVEEETVLRAQEKEYQTLKGRVKKLTARRTGGVEAARHRLALRMDQMEKSSIKEPTKIWGVVSSIFGGYDAEEWQRYVKVRDRLARLQEQDDAAFVKELNGRIQVLETRLESYSRERQLLGSYRAVYERIVAGG